MEWRIALPRGREDDPGRAISKRGHRKPLETVNVIVAQLRQKGIQLRPWTAYVAFRAAGGANHHWVFVVQRMSNSMRLLLNIIQSPE